jgi:hypothetical protein
MRLTYKDEEGDDIAVTTDDELLEAFRLAKEARPPLLRLLIAPANLSVSIHTQNLLNSVPFPNSTRAFSHIPESSLLFTPREVTVTPPQVEKAKPIVMPESQPLKPNSPQFSFPKQEKSVFSVNKESSLDSPSHTVFVSGKAYVPKTKPGMTKPYTGPTKVQDNAIAAGVNPGQSKPSLVSITNTLAEKISSMVLESSDSTLVSSSLFSDAISDQTQKLSENTRDSNMEIARVISEQTNKVSHKSEALELDDNIRRSLSDACYETGMNSVKLSDQIAAITNQNSNQITEDITPISSNTRNLQDAATQGLEDHLSKQVDDVVRDIMSATKIN